MWMSEMQKAKLSAYRMAMDAAVEAAREDTAAINRVATLARPWKPGAYAVGDVRVYGGIPYRCVQAHDSTQNLAGHRMQLPPCGCSTTEQVRKPRGPGWLLLAHTMYIARAST